MFKTISDDFNQDFSRAIMERKRSKITLIRHGWVSRHPVIGLQIPLGSSTEEGPSEIPEWLSNLQEATGQGMLWLHFRKNMQNSSFHSSVMKRFRSVRYALREAFAASMPSRKNPTLKTEPIARYPIYSRQILLRVLCSFQNPRQSLQRWLGRHRTPSCGSITWLMRDKR